MNICLYYYYYYVATVYDRKTLLREKGGVFRILASLSSCSHDTSHLVKIGVLSITVLSQFRFNLL